MPATVGLECQGYPTTRLKATYTGRAPQLQDIIRGIGTQTRAFAVNADPHKRITMNDPVSNFVEADVVVIKDGYRLDAKGNKTSIRNEMLATITPQMAHGGCYSYGPVAQRFAELLAGLSGHQGLKVRSNILSGVH